MSLHTTFLLLITTFSLLVRGEVTTDSSYGERLAESYVFNSVSNREQIKEESSYAPGISAILNSDGFLNTMTKYNSEPKYSPNGPVEAAVHTKKTIEVIPVKFEEPQEGEPQVIEISPYEVPLSIVFKTQTNKINVNQEHKSGKGYNYTFMAWARCHSAANKSIAHGVLSVCFAPNLSPFA